MDSASEAQIHRFDSGENCLIQLYNYSNTGYIHLQGKCASWSRLDREIICSVFPTTTNYIGHPTEMDGIVMQ